VLFGCGNGVRVRGWGSGGRGEEKEISELKIGYFYYIILRVLDFRNVIFKETFQSIIL
jgi:hypothetical protein